MMELAASAATALRGLFQPTQPLKGKWDKIAAPPLPRSSHSLSVINGRAYIFGGEVSPREPVDNDMHIIILPSGTVTEADYKTVTAKSAHPGGEVPEKRVGHTAAVIGERIFVFGGRGGKEMKPLEENGRVWVYDTRTDLWSHLDPEKEKPFPVARSYHSSVAIEKPEAPSTVRKAPNPLTDEPRAGTVADAAKDEQGEDRGYGTVFIHAGCPSSGRLNDLWGFDVRERTWKEYPSAPGKPRGGTALAVAKSRLYRFGGFNGEGEEGGQVDFLELGVETFSSFSNAADDEVALTAKGTWDSLSYEADENINESGQPGGNREWPGKRSVAGMEVVTTGMGREFLLVFLGERDPSSQGHDGAGKFWGDVWTLQLPPLGMSGASWKDATWQALNKQTGEGLWTQVYTEDAEGAEGDDVRNLVPGERGWFASASMGDLDPSAIVLWGGLNGKNEREDSGFILRIH